MQIHRPLRLLPLLALLPLSSCGEAPGPAPQSISEFLQVAGYDTAPTTRQLSETSTFDPQHAPLGERRTLLPQEEVFVAARNLLTPSGPFLIESHAALLSDLDPSPSLVTLGTTGLDPDEPWEDSSGLVDGDQAFFEFYKPRRGWVRGDFLGTSNDQVVELALFDGQSPPFCRASLYSGDGLSLLIPGILNVSTPVGSVQLLSSSAPSENHFHFAAGDVDADGLDELVVAFRDESTAFESSGVRILIYDVSTSGGFQGPKFESIYIDQAELPGVEFPNEGIADDKGRDFWIEIACGNIDEDPFEEIVLTYNDNREDLSFETIESSRYEIFDLQFGGFESIANGVVGSDGSGVSGDLEFSRATARLLQIDGDPELEIIFAGIDKEVDPDDEDEDLDARYGLFSYDWTGSDLALTGSLTTEHEVSGVKPARIQFAFLKSLDLNGDGFDEVLFGNSFVRPVPDPEEDAMGIGPTSVTWERVESSNGPLTLENSIFETNEGSNAGLSFGRLRCSFSTGDVDGDGREELAFLGGGPGTNVIDILRLSLYGATPSSLPGEGEEIDLEEKMASTELLADETGSGESINLPTVHFLNTQDDSYEIEHILDFSTNAWMEPVLVAAAVAPPANNFGTQSIDASQTFLGAAGVSGAGTETPAGSVPIVETGDGGGDFSLEVSAECVVHLQGGNTETSDPLRTAIATAMRPTFTRGSFYDAVHRVRFGTKPLEHTLVFATTSHDKYRYRITRVPSPDLEAELLDREVQIRAPRELELFAMERSQYNKIAPDQQHLITTDIINVAPGSVGSYPSYTEWLELHSTPDGPPVGATPPITPVTLGSENATFATQQFNDFLGGSGGIQFDEPVDVASNTAQPIQGFRVSTEFLAPIRIRSIQGSIWTGQVGGIASQAEFDNQFYRWGMGIRLATLEGPGWQFPVFDYFLE